MQMALQVFDNMNEQQSAVKPDAVSVSGVCR